MNPVLPSSSLVAADIYVVVLISLTVGGAAALIGWVRRHLG
jgi:hypothetical protein